MSSKPDLFALQGSLLEAAAEPFALDNFLPWRLMAAARAIERRLAGVVSEEFGFSLAEWQVLACLMRTDSVSVREIGPRVGLDSVAVSRAATRLADRKYLRKRENAADRRLIILTPTKKGRDAAEAIGERLTALEKDILTGMHLQDRIRLSQLLKPLSRRD
ncbi:MarR family transcriptional regulator [Breoghania sp. L-A4]|uniref:MarR family winged helix-turn-helix transcriptional regulator n=1 Tax=Breoghania sp. L-A4 TaxID=2304600 RepID=UPI0013C34FEF|nr:MarR family transcriptional regulator [Breoghania sp. L-A4]